MHGGAWNGSRLGGERSDRGARSGLRSCVRAAGLTICGSAESIRCLSGQHLRTPPMSAGPSARAQLRPVVLRVRRWRCGGGRVVRSASISFYETVFTTV